MPKAKSIYLFLLSLVLCSIFFGLNVFFIALGISILIIIFLNRGIYYTLRANRLLVNKQREKGYELLRKAYLTGNIPYIVTSGYIFLSLKFGHLDNAMDAITETLIKPKLKPRYKKELLSHKALYYWSAGDIDNCLDIMNNLYEGGYKNSNFFGSYGYILTSNKEYEKAEKVIKEAIEFNSVDKISLDNEIALYIELERWDEAKEKWDYLENLHPTFPEFWYHGVLVYMHFAENEKAKELLDKAKEFPLFNLSTISQEDINQLESKI